MRGWGGSVKFNHDCIATGGEHDYKKSLLSQTSLSAQIHRNQKCVSKSKKCSLLVCQILSIQRKMFSIVLFKNRLFVFLSLQ